MCVCVCVCVCDTPCKSSFAVAGQEMPHMSEHSKKYWPGAEMHPRTVIFTFSCMMIQSCRDIVEQQTFHFQGMKNRQLRTPVALVCLHHGLPKGKQANPKQDWRSMQNWPAMPISTRPSDIFPFPTRSNTQLETPGVIQHLMQGLGQIQVTQDT